MKDIKVKEERGNAELPKMVRHAPKEFVRRGLAVVKEKGGGQLMQAAQNGMGNPADTEDGMRPDAQEVVDSGVGLVEDTAAGGKELLRHLPSREKFIKRDEHREAVRARNPYAEYMEKRPQAVERPKRIAAETNLGDTKQEYPRAKNRETAFQRAGAAGKGGAPSARGGKTGRAHIEESCPEDPAYSAGCCKNCKAGRQGIGEYGQSLYRSV